MKIYKFIPLILTIIIAVVLLLNATKRSAAYVLLHPDKFPGMSMKSNLVSFGLFFLLPTVIVIIVGTNSIERFKQGRKSSFITWIFFFILWLGWFLMLTRFEPLIDPLLMSL